MTYLPNAQLAGVPSPYSINSLDIATNWVDLGIITVPQHGFSNAKYLGNGVVIAAVGNSTNNIIRSVDYGLTWNDQIAVGTFATATKLCYYGNGVLTFLTGIANTQMFRSTDYGITWTDLGNVSPTTIFDITYLGHRVAIFGNFDGHIYRSTDSGANWIDKGLITVGGHASGRIFAVGYVDNGITLCGDENGRIFRSTNFGNTWISTALVSGQGIAEFIYIGKGIVLLSDNNGHIFRSSDYGITWDDLGVIGGFTLVSVGAFANFGNGIIVAHHLSVAAGHTFRSTNYGLTWDDNVISTSNISFTLNLGNGIGIFGDGIGHIFRSDVSTKLDDVGQRVHNDLTNRNLPGISAHNSQLVGTLSAYSLNSSDIGTNWLDLGPITSGETFSFSYLGNGIVIAVCGDRHIWRSTDYGATWFDIGLFTNGFLSSEYLGNGIVVAGANNGHEWRSVDFGLTWTDIGDISTNTRPIMSFSYLGMGFIIAVTDGIANTGRILQSVDYGLTYASVVSTATKTYRTSSYLENGIVIVGDDNSHIWRSTNFGTNWTDLGIITGSLNMRSCYLANGIILLGSFDGHIWRSTDYGLTWNDLGVIPNGFNDISYLGNGTVVIPDGNGTIFRSSDYGLTWTNLLYAFGTVINVSKALDNGIVIASDTTNHIYRSDVPYKKDEKHPPILDYSFYRKTGGSSYYSGTIIDLPGTVSHGAGADEIDAVPIIFSRTTKVDRIAIDVTIACGAVCITAGANIRLGLYKDNGNVYPGALIQDAGAVDISGTGIREIAINQTLTQGLYWLVSTYHTPAVCAVPPTVRQGTYLPILGNYVLGLDFGWPLGVYVKASIDYSAGLPNPFVAGAGASPRATLVSLRIA
ncbi:MAG: hypothetical protein O8C67_05160 [Candidatus Methanoperedens sp.]|nr:hypothetical protein [Candidatus Methanoperedens sp.]